MGTRRETLAHILATLADLPGLSARPMFGEAALYLDGKVVALVCDDALYVKPTPGAMVRLPEAAMAPPYPGARPHLLADAALDDPARLAAALRAVWADLPAPKPKRPRTPRA